MFTPLQFLVLLCFQYAVPALIIEGPNLNTGPEQGNSCETCAKVLDHVKDLLLNAEVQVMAKNNMTILCEMLHKPVPAKFCKEMVDKYLPIVFAAAEKLLNQEDLCSAAGLCGHSENEMSVVMEQLRTALTSPYFEEAPRTLCFLCTFVVDRVIGLLPIDQVEDVLTTVLGLVCDILPGPGQVACQTLVDKLITTVTGVLRSILSSDLICSILQFCSSVETPTMVSP
ncbi:hypothetical protein ACEWY4_025328 [Coilia grayii]|uniref:Saposin B-type domain-containing protein n=1 Tax=Coilia grayii TaxID=363190 RepID=A0ABD1IY97_9TELE